jgi:tryptophan synthase alpha chain
VSRIETAIRRARKERGRGAFVPFLTAGYPSLDATVELALALADRGADVIEIGIPFSDPLADGPVIQASSQAALAGGVTPAAALDAIGQLTRASEVPIVVMTYLNPLMQLEGGLLRAARQAGFAGVILTDLPIDQQHEVWDEVAEAEVDPILLVTPTTSEQRVRRIAARGAGFIYCVARMGVTGAGETRLDALDARLAVIRAASTLPVLVGFGVRGRDDAAQLGGMADGVVVGSALVERLAGGDSVAAALSLAGEVIEGLEQAAAAGGPDQSRGAER